MSDLNEDGEFGTSRLGSLLRSTDLDTLQSTYGSLLDSAVSAPSRVEPDSNALFIQAGLPLLLAGLLKGKKGIIAASKPVTSVYARELDRAAKDAERSRDNDLKAAQLVGQRIGDVQDTFEKAAALEERKQQAAASLEERQLMRLTMDENADLTREMTRETRAQAAQDRADRAA